METAKHSMETEEEKVELGIHTITHGFNRKIEATITKIIDGSIRSGKRIEFDGSLVIIGDVNAGAEVIASEHIIIFGTLRGLAHAGARGNREAKIITNEIDELITHSIFYTSITRAKEKLKIYWSPECQNKIISTIKHVEDNKDVNLIKNKISPI